MPTTANDIPIKSLRHAAREVGAEARKKAFSVGGSVSYIMDGMIVRESNDGHLVVVAPTASREIRMKKRVWKLG